MSQSENAGAQSLTRLLYVSDLSPNTRATEVSRIVSSSRRRNARDGITGLTSTATAFASMSRARRPQ